ncbi:hypothetical protein OF001_U10195 [Pseudomonas sp. OF001]|nr:hypothetical protein OF001_U10195 [Pseudomonas sp. OF001]
MNPRVPPRRSIRREAVQQSRPARRRQRLVAAAAPRGVRGVPRARWRTVVQALAIVVTDHGRAGGAAGPVAAGAVLRAGEGGAVGLRAGEDVVHVRRIAAALDRHAALVEAGFLVEVVVAVQLGDVLGDQLALGVVPGARADAVAGVHRRLAVTGAGAEVGAPGVAAGTDGLGELLAVRIGASQAAEIGALAHAGAGDEEGHLGLGEGAAAEGQGGQRQAALEGGREHGAASPVDGGGTTTSS